MLINCNRWVKSKLEATEKISRPETSLINRRSPKKRKQQKKLHDTIDMIEREETESLKDFNVD